MDAIRITLTNFRCFDDTDPAVIEIGPGFTALVGPNNAGKSSVLRAFYELRSLFGLVADAGTVTQLLRGASVSIPINSVPDTSVLQCDANQRPMSIRIACTGINNHAAISGVQLTFTRERPSAATAKYFSGPDHVELPTSDNAKFLDSNQLRVRDKHFDISTFRSALIPLSQTVYIGPFRNVLNQGASDYFDLTVGTAFINTWNQWKNGDSRANNHAIKRVEDSIGHLFGYERLEINPSLDRNKLRVFIDGQSFDLQDQGSGLAQFVLVFASAATRKPSFVLIDEPESNLHPSLQIDFLTTLGTFAAEGVLFATHSIGLARSVADRIYSLQRAGNRTLMRLYDETPNLTEFAGELSFSAYREFGFDRLLLVEGPTDVRTFQQFLRKLDKDRHIVILPLLGHAFASGKHTDALVELTRIAPPKQIVAVVDSERPSAGGPVDPRRAAFVAECGKLGINAHLTERRATENYFSARAIKESLGEQFDALDAYEKHDGPPLHWNKSLNWKIAHAMTIEELEDTDLLTILRSL